jgi:hypothetical protein
MRAAEELEGAAPRRRAVGRRPTLPPRLLLPTDRADLRISWHPDGDVFILTLWHGDVCVGSAPLPPADAAEVASFLVGQLGCRRGAEQGPARDGTRPAPAAERGPPVRRRGADVAGELVRRVRGLRQRSPRS